MNRLMGDSNLRSYKLKNSKERSLERKEFMVRHVKITRNILIHEKSQRYRKMKRKIL